jgi:hypothetical protein
VKILKSLIENESEIPVPTFEKVFKFSLSVENIKRMLTSRINMERDYAKRI